MKYVSPKYEYEVLEVEDIMGISDLFGAIFETNDTDGDEVDDEVSVSVDVGNLLP